MDTFFLLNKSNRKPAPRHAWLAKQANLAEHTRTYIKFIWHLCSTHYGATLEIEFIKIELFIYLLNLSC